MTQKQSVVIIGGGPAGLTAAWELVKDGGSEQYDVTVLEATREFGGISRTVKHDGNRMDIGGHRFFQDGVSFSGGNPCFSRYRRRYSFIRSFRARSSSVTF